MIVDPRPEMGRTPKGFLEVDPRWLAGLWGLRATGSVTVVLGKIHVEVEHPTLSAGQIVVGQIAHGIIPTGFVPKS